MIDDLEDAQGCANIDPATVEGFGKEWNAFDQDALTGAEYDNLFDRYFAIFPFEQLPPEAEGFDLGCGSGRWAKGVLEHVGTLHCMILRQRRSRSLGEL